MTERNVCSVDNPLRTNETESKYQEDQKAGLLDHGCIFCDLEPVVEFEHWKIIKNKYPYDKVTCVHDMIYPKRHVAEKDLNEEEINELAHLKGTYLNERYQFIIEPLPKHKSIPNHFHIHLVVTDV